MLAWIFHAAVVDLRPLATLWIPLAWLLATMGLRAAAAALRGMIAARASRLVRTELRVRLFRVLCLAGPQHKQDSGHLLSSLVDQVEALDPYFARYRPQAVAAALIPALILVAVTTVDWLAGLLLALAAPLIPVFMILVGWGAEQASQRQQQALGRLSGLFHDRLRALAQIRRLGAGPAELKRLRAYSEEFRDRTMRVLRLAFLSSAVLEFFAAVAIASLAIYIGLGLLGFITFGPADKLTLASGLFVLLLAPEFFNPLRQLAQHWHDRADALAAATDIRALLDLPPARPVPAGRPPRMPDRSYPVEARRLSHAWPGRQRILEDLDLRVDAGEHLLINGPSGCGKSTLISALAGFISPSAGNITYAGIDLGRLDQQSLARSRSWLGQRPVLFAGTLASNIAIGKTDASAAEIQKVAELAGVDEFARHLPLGLNSRIGEQGLGLSGGQAQRLALARVLLDPRPLLLLDEPTTSLDELSETLIWDAIRHVSEQRPMTVICASHSALAQRWAGRILSLHDGHLSAHGP